LPQDGWHLQSSYSNSSNSSSSNDNKNNKAMVTVVVVSENNGLVEDTYEFKLQILGSKTTEDLVSNKLTKGAKGTQTSLFAVQTLWCMCIIT